VLARIALDAADSARLLAAARARGCSLHALFQLAYVRAAGAFHRRRGVARRQLRVWDFFSLRPLLEQGAPRYDCLALIYPVGFDSRASDAALLAEATARVQTMRAGGLLEHAARFQSLMALLPPRRLMRAWPALFKSNVFLTNPGVCPSPLPRFGERAVLDYVTFPQLFAPADLLFVFSTFRGRLRILTVRDEAAFGPAFHAELMAPFLAALGALGDVTLDPSAAADGFAARWTDAGLDEARPAAAALKRSA
jgi:hypothetical protein